MAPQSNGGEYLGVVLDKQLNFRAHTSLIKEKYNKAFRAQYSLICRNSSLNLNNKVLIYLAYLRPILTYASPIWACTARSNLRSIQVLENKTLRMIANARWYHRNIDIRNALNVPSPQQFIQKLAKIFYGKLPDINNPEITKIPVYDHNDKQNHGGACCPKELKPPQVVKSILTWHWGCLDQEGGSPEQRPSIAPRRVDVRHIRKSRLLGVHNFW
ncbi:hypothetical protein AVEN_23759-1 [Araneus ventricosus]|uniref:RNA-directed DNA polymerase from mobile element jockey n=1 Tax=Araneus ventricosus TaxID=182803 RepID=A0A4Y2RVZ9_ARAVE|nr:hypothetical protein AVEN_23759-1 [Araneus ventricosus]